MTAARRRAVLLLVSLTTFVTITYELSPVGLLSVLAEQLGTDVPGAGLLVSSYALVVAVGSIPLSAVVARYDARTSLLVQLGVLAVSALLLASAPSLAVGLVARLLGGAAHAVIITTVYRLALSVMPLERRGRTASTVALGNGLALVVGVPLVTALGTATPWRVPYTVLAVALLLLVVAVIMVVPARLAGEGTVLSTRTLLRAVLRPPLLRVGVTTTVVVSGHFVTFTYVEPLLLRAGVGPAAVSAVLLAYGAAGVAALVVETPLGDRRPRTLFLIMLGLLLVALVLLLLGGRSASLSVVAVVLWGFAFGGVPVLVQVLAIKASPAAPTAAAPLINTTFNAGATAGSAAGGALLAAAGPGTLIMTSITVITTASALGLVRHWLPADR